VIQAATARRPAPIEPPMRLFVPLGTWPRLLFLFAISSVLAVLAVGDVGLWLPVGLGFSLFVTAQAVVASRNIPWIPGLIGMVACLQWIVMPYLSYRVAPYYPLFAMILPPVEYFSYAVPATMALVLGVYLPLLGIRRHPGRNAGRGRERSRAIRSTCEAMVWGGLAVRLLIVPSVPSSLGFAALLLANLSFVGVFGLVLTGARGWLLRAVAVFSVLVVQSSAEGMFHELLLWSAYLGAIIAFRHRVRARNIAVVSVAAFLTVLALNGIKQGYRTALGTQSELTAVGRLQLLANVFADLLTDTDALLSDENLSLNITRLNQGWIIARILTNVPSNEPFAEGETVVASLQATLLPRLLAPNKLVIGGHEYFTRFTGVMLGRDTSMDLSVAGEMYANFGRLGGLAGVFVFGVLLGLLFRLFVAWSRDSILWWSWAPFVMLYTAKAEGSVAEPLNHVTKAFVVMLVVIAVLPGWVALRRFKLRRRRAAAGAPVAMPGRPVGFQGHG
jgi:hypothetical protein